MEHSDTQPETEESVLTTKWAHGGTTLYKEAKSTPSIPPPHPATVTLTEEDEYDRPQRSGPINKRASQKHKLLTTLIIVGVVLVGVVGLLMLVSQPSEVDKTCQDTLGPEGIWVPQMNMCGCKAGYQLAHYGEECVPD
jgi:hypothetical protein